MHRRICHTALFGYTAPMQCSYGTHVLLEACRVYRRIRRFICVSTDEVYGDTSLGAVSGKDGCRYMCVHVDAG